MFIQYIYTYIFFKTQFAFVHLQNVKVKAVLRVCWKSCSMQLSHWLFQICCTPPQKTCVQITFPEVNDLFFYLTWNGPVRWLNIAIQFIADGLQNCKLQQLYFCFLKWTWVTVHYEHKALFEVSLYSIPIFGQMNRSDSFTSKGHCFISHWYCLGEDSEYLL